MNLKDLLTFLFRQQIGAEDQMLFIWLSVACQEVGFTETTNGELAELIRKHETNISKSLKRLKDARLIEVIQIDNVRQIRLSDTANSLINYSNYLLIEKEINNKIIINKEHIISEEDCNKIAEALVIDGFLNFDPAEVNKYLLEQAHLPLFNKIKNPKQLKSFIKAILNKGINNSKFSSEFDLDYENSILQIENALRVFCGFDLIQLEEHDVYETFRIKNERILKKHIKEQYIKNVEDFTNKPQELQKKYTGFKLVSLVGTCNYTYIGGKPAIYNIFLDVNGCQAFASIPVSHQPELEKLSSSDLKGTTIKIVGKLTYSKWHFEKFKVANIIRSTEVLTPVQFLTPMSSGEGIDLSIFDMD